MILILNELIPAPVLERQLMRTTFCKLCGVFARSWGRCRWTKCTSTHGKCAGERVRTLTWGNLWYTHVCNNILYVYIIHCICMPYNIIIFVRGFLLMPIISFCSSERGADFASLWLVAVQGRFNNPCRTRRGTNSLINKRPYFLVNILTDAPSLRQWWAHAMYLDDKFKVWTKSTASLQSRPIVRRFAWHAPPGRGCRCRCSQWEHKQACHDLRHCGGGGVGGSKWLTSIHSSALVWKEGGIQQKGAVILQSNHSPLFFSKCSNFQSAAQAWWSSLAAP